MFPVLAILCFLLSAFGVNHIGQANLVDIGLAFLGFALLVGNWPIGALAIRRNP